MSEQRGSWFQRLLGGDASALGELEAQLARTQSLVEELEQALAEERVNVTARDERIAGLEARASAATTAHEAALAEQKQRLETERSQSQAALEAEHRAALAGLKSASVRQIQQAKLEKDQLAATLENTKKERDLARTQLTAQAEEKAELERALAQARAELSQLHADARAKNTRVTELEAALKSRVEAERAAEARALATEEAAKARAKQLTEAERRCRELDARLLAVEAALAESQRARKEAEAQATASRSQLGVLGGVRDELTRVRTELEQATEAREELRVQRDATSSAARDLWQTLRQSLGDAASLALAFGVELGPVPKCSDVASAAHALKAALNERALCRELKIESVAQGLLVEVRPALALEGDAVAQWLAAFVTEYLEKALQIGLSAESTSHNRDWLELRLGRSGPAAPISESAPS